MNAETFYKNLGHNLKQLRKAKGMTQEQLGEQIGLTKSAIVNYEAGIRKIPIDVLTQLASFHNVTIDSLTVKPHTIAEIIKSEIGSIELTEHEEDLLINFIKALKHMKEVNQIGKSNSKKQK